MPGDARIQTIAADLVGFDITGFSRFAETWLEQGEGSDVDDLARLWERAAAPQIQRLIDAGYEVADVCGDGVAMFRDEPLEGAAVQQLLAEIAAGFAAAAPGLSLRTARSSGDLALVNVEALGVTYDWASGVAIDALHTRLNLGPRAAAGSPQGDWLGQARQDEVLAFQWSQTGAEVRFMATLFVRLAPEPWMWSEPGRIAETVRRIAACVASADGRLEKVTHDDKGLLFHCAFFGGQDDPTVAAARAGRMIIASGLAREAGAAVSEGRAYRGPLRAGPASLVTMHGPAVNRAAKACAQTRGLVVLAQADEVRGARLRAIGLEADQTAAVWTGAAPNLAEDAPPEPVETELFIGREASIARLEERLPDAAIATSTVVVEGAPGVGKTALVRRFTSELPPGWRQASTQAAPVDGLFGPWPQLLRRLVSVSFHDDPGALVGALATQGEVEVDLGLLSHLGLAGVQAPTDVSTLEPLALRASLDRLFKALIRVTGGRVVLVIEDAHWLTAEGWRWVDLCRDCEGGRLILITEREGHEGRRPIAGAHRVHLPPLSAAEGHLLVRHRRPDLAPHADARSAIALLGRGSPLLLEQLARAWPDPGGEDFAGFQQRMAGTRPADGGVLERVLDIRLDRLKPGEMDVLRRLAIEGRARRVEELEPDGRDAAEFDRIARRLIRLGVVQSDATGALAPRHALIGAATRRRTPGLLLRVLHARAARRLTHAGDEPALVGAHWLQARGALWLARAASAAESNGALRSAIGLYQRALEACPQTAHRHRRAQVWRSRLAAAAFGIGELAQARAEAANCLPGLRLVESRRRALLVQTEIATFTADVPTAMRSLGELRRLGRTEVEGLRGRDAAVWAYALALVRVRPLASSLLDRAYRIGPLDRYYVQASRGLIHTCFAEWDAAEAALSEAMAISPPERLPHENEIAATLLALGLYLRDRPGESLDVFDQIRTSGRGRDNGMHEAWGLYGGAQALIALGRLDDAKERLDQAEILLEGHIDRQSQLICSGLRVALADQRDDLDGLLEAMTANGAITETMPASNFGSYQGYVATPTAALRRLISGDMPSPHRAALRGHAEHSLKALDRYALLFPVGRPRRALCGALHAAAEGRPRAARDRLARGAALARRLQMPGEAALADSISPLIR